MQPIQTMAYQFKLEAKRSDGINAIDIPIPQIVMWLNKGMMSLLKKRYGTSNSYRSSLESIQKRIDEWQRLVVTHEKLSLKKEDNDRYTGDLTKTKKPYLFMLNCSFIATKGACENVKMRSFPSYSDDLDLDLDNPNRKPNFEWREMLHRIAEDKIIAYTDTSFAVSKANIDYLRYPQKLDLEGYEHPDGTASSNQDCELPEFLQDDIIVEAVMLYKLRMNHPDQQSAIQAASITE